MRLHDILKTGFVVIAVSSIFGGIVLMYVCSHGSCRFGTSLSLARSTAAMINEYPFDVEGEDIIVFLHIQKTGGTKFGKHLVKNLNIKRPCDCIPRRKRCTCQRPNSTKTWLFSRYSLGWPCGLHADWTELHACVPGLISRHEGKRKKRKYLYITILREPVARCVSEFRCYQRGSTWKDALHKCNGRVPTKKELPPCYKGENWTDVTFPEFLNCSSNLAFNRQTRMLADLRLVGCYDSTVMPQKRRDEILLKSAKINLESMTYFALVEYQRESQYLFEKTLGMKFYRPFTQLSAEDTRAGALSANLDPRYVTRLEERNRLDIELYSFAKELFFKRLKHFEAIYGDNSHTTNTEPI